MTRQTTSLILAFSGLVLLVTSIVLYFSPAGQVSHFCPWSFWGLHRHHWAVLHLNSGLLFCIAMMLHTYLNWKALLSYLKHKRPHWSTIPITLSLALTLYVCVGGYYELPPMKQYLGIAHSFRMDSIKKYGSPPYGAAAEYPVSFIAKYMGWDPEKALKQLARNNIVLQSPKQSLNNLAETNQSTIGHLLDIMRTDVIGGSNEKI